MCVYIASVAHPKNVLQTEESVFETQIADVQKKIKICGAHLTGCKQAKSRFCGILNIQEKDI